MIRYRRGYKYQLAEDYSLPTGMVGPTLRLQFIHMDDDGYLTIKKGYAWDGPSGPTFDTPGFMRGSLVHDALYQIMQEGYIPTKEMSAYREAADDLLYRLIREDGMNWLRAQWVHKAVRVFGKYAAPTPKAIHTAP